MPDFSAEVAENLNFSGKKCVKMRLQRKIKVFVLSKFYASNSI